jgi:transposase
MRKIREVLRLALDEQLSLRQIHASLGVPATTAGEYLARAKRAGLRWPLPEDASDDALEQMLFPPVAAPSDHERPVPDWGRVHLELKRPNVTLMLLWEEYREDHPDGYAYTQFCHHYRLFAKKVDVTMRLPHKAGERMWVDFAGSTVPLWDETLSRVVGHSEIFVSVLGASSLAYAEALASQELIHWVGAHDHAYHFYGGVPPLTVCDNLLSGITKANRYEPKVNPTYQDMATHYGTAILPTRPRRPRDKAKVEAGVLLVSRWILARLRDERFCSVAEVNLAIAPLLIRVNNKPFRALSGSRRSVFEELDRPALRALPEHPYDFAFWKRAKVGPGYHVEVRADRHFYSVPYQLAGEHVELRVGTRTIEIFHKGARKASHPRSFVRYGYSTTPSHMPKSHQRHLEWSPERITSWANKSGPATASLAQAIMAERPHPEQGYRACLGIIRLSSTYGATRLEAACERALAIHSHTYTSVASILKKGLDKKPLATPSLPRTHPHHDYVRGPNSYQ